MRNDLNDCRILDNISNLYVLGEPPEETAGSVIKIYNSMNRTITVINLKTMKKTALLPKISTDVVAEEGFGILYKNGVFNILPSDIKRNIFYIEGDDTDDRINTYRRWAESFKSRADKIIFSNDKMQVLYQHPSVPVEDNSTIVAIVVILLMIVISIIVLFLGYLFCSSIIKEGL